MRRRLTDRRTCLRTATLAGATALAGCLGRFGLNDESDPDDGDGSRGGPGGEAGTVYYPPHVHGMKMAGMAMEPPYGVGLMLANPHRFWTVTGSDLSEHAIEDDHDLHLMAVVFHPETETVLPDAGVSLEISRDGELVSEEVIYPMLSQRMGFHYGGNFGVPEDDTYTARVSVGGVSIRRTGEFEGTFERAASFDIEFEFDRRVMNGLPYSPLPDRHGEPGAVEPMAMQMPTGVAPAASELPGELLGSETSADAVLVATVVRDAERLPGDGRPYLAVSARTPYNRMTIPLMGLSAGLERGGETVFDGVLERTLDPELGYHYGAAVDSVESGDVLALTVDTPPQVARHLGYEKAFLEMPDVEIEV